MSLLKPYLLAGLHAGLGAVLGATAFTPQAHAEEGEASNLHFQATTITQGHPSMTSPYQGANSLSGGSEIKTSFTTTLFFGYRLLPNTAVYADPEVSAGEGLSTTHGVAGFPNGEIYRVDTPSAKLNPSRLYLQHVIELGGEKEVLDSDKNQLADRLDRKRITLVLGKFSLNDFFDDNTYSHDPRTQFMNWALMDDAAWDYAADTRGYTWGLYVEFNQPVWAARFAFVTEPIEANAMQLDPHLETAYGANWEFEYRYALQDHPGKTRLLSYLNRAHMGSYSATLANPSLGEDVTQTRQYRLKYGFGLNLEQELNSSLGAFMRAGWDDGTTETWNFTEVDRTISLGISQKGAPWRRAGDTFGLALISNWLSADHAHYLAAGGYGFIIGDGALNYAPEQILETYYSVQVLKSFYTTADYQWVNHPAYNADRGPVSIYSIRLHFEI
jgi:high affinity Mn2+ porin